MGLENRHRPGKALLYQLPHLNRYDGIGGIHGDQDALNPKPVVAVLPDDLVVPEQLRQSLRG